MIEILSKANQDKLLKLPPVRVMERVKKDIFAMLQLLTGWVAIPFYDTYKGKDTKCIIIRVLITYLRNGSLILEEMPSFYKIDRRTFSLIVSLMSTYYLI